MLVQFEKRMYHPIYLIEMKDCANEVSEYKNTLMKYYNLLEPGEEKTEVYWNDVVGVDNIIAEVVKEIQSYESDWYDKMKEYSGFMLFMGNCKIHNRLEGVVTSIKHRQERIKEMYNRAKERV